MFRRLVIHFSRRIIQGGSEDSGEVQLSLGAMLALLASPGVILAIGLLDKYSSLLRYVRGQPVNTDLIPRSTGDGCMLLAFSMAITGLVTVWKWDRILPDLTDRLNLGPLPVPATQIFFSSLAAIVLVTLTFILDVNAGSMFIFPMVVTADQHSPVLFARLLLAHLTALLLGSIFIFCFCFSTMGLLVALVPRSIFASVSVLLRALLALALGTVLLTAGSGPAFMHLARNGVFGWHEWLPPVWFASLYGPLMSRPELGRADLWQRGLWVLAISAAVALLTYAAGYQRGMEGALARSPRLRRWPRLLLLQGLTPLERASFSFGLRMLWRSERHSLLLLSAIGLGIIVGGRSGNYGAIPFTTGYAFAIALRAAIDIPALPSANWPFRLLAVAHGDEPYRAARRIIWLHLVVFIIIPSALLNPLASTFTLVTMLAVLVDLLLLSYRQIPGTVRPVGFRNTRLVYALLALIGFGLFPWAGGKLASHIAANPLRALWPAALAAVVLYQRARVASDLYNDRPLLAFEQEDEEVTRLGL